MFEVFVFAAYFKNSFTIDNKRTTSDGGSNDGNGGINVRSNAEPTIKNSIIKGNDLTLWNRTGAGIYINGGGATIESCTIGDSSNPNKAANGAGIYVTASGAWVTVGNSTISSNNGTCSSNPVHVPDT